ncbi:hypothetical protein K469DRAFT_744811 [Zopfia rhizophila CBS 207.26]|uniref:Uncharacterized protein n=1 Tax=Zopfia rhizophila CBS 207.26 TaxID=1314779 RepID=A0A6A6EPH2_9PEZI|nr:hypothetical protein K469DRAFT_744811 [Zopfia rhizophila CBS 207.26]
MLSFHRPHFYALVLSVVNICLVGCTISPAPTSPPLFKVTAVSGALQLRADGQPPALCGFVDYTFSWACGPQSTCLYNTDISGVGCCNALSSCDYATSCVPSSYISGAASSAKYVLYCSDSRSPVCATATLDFSFYSYRCFTEDWSWFIYLSSTRPDATTPVQLITKLIAGSSVVDAAGTSSAVPRTMSSNSADRPNSAASMTSTAFTTDSLSNSTSDHDGDNVQKKKNSLTGPIAGGVCGGIVLILAVLFVWFFIGRKKKLKGATTRSIDPGLTTNLSTTHHVHQNPDTFCKPELEGSAVVTELPGMDITPSRIR